MRAALGLMDGLSLDGDRCIHVIPQQQPSVNPPIQNIEPSNQATPQLVGEEDLELGKPREGHTKLEIRFKNGLPAPVTVILYATFPEIMTIDQARNVRLEIKDKFAQRRERN